MKCTSHNVLLKQREELVSVVTFWESIWKFCMQSCLQINHALLPGLHAEVLYGSPGSSSLFIYFYIANTIINTSNDTIDDVINSKCNRIVIHVCCLMMLAMMRLMMSAIMWSTPKIIELLHILKLSQFFYSTKHIFLWVVIV